MIYLPKLYAAVAAVIAPIAGPPPKILVAILAPPKIALELSLSSKFLVPKIFPVAVATAAISSPTSRPVWIVASRILVFNLLPTLLKIWLIGVDLYLIEVLKLLFNFW